MAGRFAGLALGVLFQASAASGETLTDDQVLQAAFVAFQPAEVFSLREINNSRLTLMIAAHQGNVYAMSILARQKSLVGFPPLPSAQGQLAPLANPERQLENR